MQTALFRRLCQGCGRRLTVRLYAEDGTTQVLCDTCLAARVEAVQAAREAGARCGKGHALTQDNVVGGSGGRRRCKACTTAARKAWATRRKQARQGGAARVRRGSL